jgi:hypothetical protein
MGFNVETVELKKKILRLLREDEEFKLAVAGLLGFDTILNELKKLREDFQHFVREQERRWEENSKRWEEANRRFEVLESELRKLREDFNKFVELQEKKWEENNRRWEEEAKRWEENNRRWEENNKRWEEAYKRFEAIERKLLEHDKRFEAIERKLLEHDRRFNSLMRRITAIGARWGIHTETAFRRAMRGIIEEILGKGRVEKWVYFDENGEVYGYPSQVEVDVLIKNGLRILVEVKASASIADVSILWRKGKLYEKVTGVKPRLVLITPFIDKNARETAVKQGVEVYTRV